MRYEGIVHEGIVPQYGVDYVCNNPRKSGLGDIGWHVSPVGRYTSTLLVEYP